MIETLVLRRSDRIAIQISIEFPEGFEIRIRRGFCRGKTCAMRLFLNEIATKYGQFLKYHFYEQMDRLYVGQVLPNERMKNGEY